MQDSIEFLGALSHAEVAQWLCALDYFVLPCVKDSNGDMDGIPVALMEAMLIGVPVISTDISGLPELVIHDQTGLVARSGDADALAAVMQNALDEPDDKVWQRNLDAQQLVSSEYDLHNNAKKLASMIVNQ